MRWKELRTPLLLALVAALAMGHTPGHAAGDQDPSPLKIFQEREAQLFRVGYRLATANAPFCEKINPASGFLIHDANAYSDPRSVRQTFGLTGDIGIQAVAADSPAAAAGMKRDDTLIAIDGIEIAANFPPSKPRWGRAQRLHDLLQTALGRGSVLIVWSNPEGERRSAEIVATPSCASNFELLDSGKGAAADGDRVQIDADFPGFAYPEDEFAAAVAHELAHNLLNHLKTLDQHGRKGRLVRLSERDADRLMPWLLANAGYDPRAAVRFMQTWGPRYGGGLFRKRSHDGWDERVEFIEAELPGVALGIAEDGHADWSKRFKRTLEVEIADSGSVN